MRWLMMTCDIEEIGVIVSGKVLSPVLNQAISKLNSVLLSIPRNNKRRLTLDQRQ